MKLFIWTDEHSYTAFAHCDTVAEARNLLRPQIGGYDGSCPERAKARKYVDEFTPAVYNGRVADFRLSASAEATENMEYADKLSLQVSQMRGVLEELKAEYEKQGAHDSERKVTYLWSLSRIDFALAAQPRKKEGE